MFVVSKLDIKMTPLGEVKVNSIAGSKRKEKEQNKIYLQNDEDDATESDSSIDTSDISTDEDDVQPTQDGQRQAGDSPPDSSVVEQPQERLPAESSGGKTEANISARDGKIVEESEMIVDSEPALFVPVSRSAAIQVSRYQRFGLGIGPLLFSSCHWNC